MVELCRSQRTSMKNSVVVRSVVQRHDIQKSMITS